MAEICLLSFSSTSKDSKERKCIYRWRAKDCVNEPKAKFTPRLDFPSRICTDMPYINILDNVERGVNKIFIKSLKG